MTVDERRVELYTEMVENMENIYDIRRNRNLCFVLPEEIQENSVLVNQKTAVIMFLHYQEMLEKHMIFIKNIPSYMDLYIISNDEETYSHILKYIVEKNIKARLIKSINRGRDISALLIAGKEIVVEYEYICFVHDKKKKDRVSEEEFNFWIENLWGNTLGSKNYILNVMHIFQQKKDIGILVPPEPLGKTYTAWYENSWNKNFRHVEQLAKELELKCDLNIDKPPITLGNFFGQGVEH